MGVGAVQDGEAWAVAFAGEEQGELVGFGAAGGDEGVGVGGVVELGGECAGDEGLDGGGGGGLVPGVEGGVEGAGGEVGGGRDGEGRAVQVGCAEGVGGVCGAGGEGVDEGPERFVVPGSLGGEYVAQCGLDAGREGVGAAGREWPAALLGSGAEGFEDGVEEGPQGRGAVGSAGERGQCAGRRGHRVLRGWEGCGAGAPGRYNDPTRMG